MAKVLKSPAKYVQGANTLFEFDRYLQGMGKRLTVILSQGGVKRLQSTLEKTFAGKNFEVTYVVFQGEATQAEVERISAIVLENNCTAVVGIGGGKVLDTAKAVAHTTERPMVIVPTVASSDSPCSSVSVLYHEDGSFDRYLFLDKCPEMVLVDTSVIVAAPSRLLVAGMGDAMATWFEARACRASGKNNQVHAKPTYAATGLAQMCWDNLRHSGLAAKLAVDAHVCTEAVETIVETNTYLSSVGFESGGLAAAHGIQKGFTFIPALHQQLHGFNVAFCVLAQLVLENSLIELKEVMDFSDSVGLPICFADLGYVDVVPEEVRTAAEKACVPTSTIHNMPFEVAATMVYEALMAADAYGRAYHAQKKMI